MFVNSDGRHLVLIDRNEVRCITGTWEKEALTIDQVWNGSEVRSVVEECDQPTTSVDEFT